jgi:hypothetical protein
MCFERLQYIEGSLVHSKNSHYSIAESYCKHFALICFREWQLVCTSAFSYESLWIDLSVFDEVPQLHLAIFTNCASWFLFLVNNYCCNFAWVELHDLVVLESVNGKSPYLAIPVT